MQYISTRGNSPAVSFIDVLTSGLAPDGGLYMPSEFPHFSIEEIDSWQDLSYQDLVHNIIIPFIGNAISEDVLKEIITESYSQFRDEDIAPIVDMGNGEYLLELFHGPTLAFKDFALQLLGRLLNHVLKTTKQNITIIGATSGDTGSAAIEGCRYSKHITLFMLHPHGRVSDIQRKQMTTVLNDNIYNLAIEGNFDDCQHAVKSMFNSPDFIKGKQLVAVNSINWARIMAQIVYYFSSYLRLGKPNNIAFSVPTGNFGDIFAGYVAYKMGLPISQLIVATNVNDILHRFFSDNNYSKSAVTATPSPSMDIQVSSNFERLLFDLYDYDGNAIDQLMKNFAKSGTLSVPEDIFDKSKTLFDSCRVNIETTYQIMNDIFDTDGMAVDPHTAIGIAAARKVRKNIDIPIVCLATAHPAKFPQAAKEAGIEITQLPEFLSDLLQKEEKVELLPNDIDTIKQFIAAHS